MKRIILGAVLAGAVNLAQADTYTYTFSPTGLGTMDGLDYYTYGFSWDLPAGQTITDATLTYSNLKLTTADANPPSLFYSTLLNTAPKGLYTGYDGDNNAPNPTPGAGVFLLGTATFPRVGYEYSTLTYNFADITGALAALDADVADGVFGLGFDPDCYYTDSSITFTITTTDSSQTHTSVPDAASTSMLLGMALVGLGMFRRK